MPTQEIQLAIACERLRRAILSGRARTTETEIQKRWVRMSLASSAGKRRGMRR